MYVCLFDIDGTLINSGGAGEAAMLEVLAEEFALTEITGNIPAAGRTDAAIVSDLFEQHGLTANDRDAFQQAYLSRLPNALLQKEGVVLPGVLDLVEELSRREDVFLGLLTGNYEVAAWAKLSHFGLDRYFTFGAFGDFHCNRDDVARAASDEISKQIGDVQPDRVWVVGDTPSDIRCARAVDAQVLAVATGIFDRVELEAHRPDILLDTLEAAEEFLNRLQ